MAGMPRAAEGSHRNKQQPQNDPPLYATVATNCTPHLLTHPCTSICIRRAVPQSPANRPGPRHFRRSADDLLRDEDGQPRLSAPYLKQLCKEMKQYTTPRLNDQLYLHFKGDPTAGLLRSRWRGVSYCTARWQLRFGERGRPSSLERLTNPSGPPRTCLLPPATSCRLPEDRVPGRVHRTALCVAGGQRPS